MDSWPKITPSPLSISFFLNKVVISQYLGFYLFFGVLVIILVRSLVVVLVRRVIVVVLVQRLFIVIKLVKILNLNFSKKKGGGAKR